MTLEEKISVMHAHKNGSQVQLRDVDESFEYPWEDCANPNWNWVDLEYRIKPEPKVVPWTADTFPMTRPVWVSRKCWADNSRALIVWAHGKGVFLQGIDIHDIEWTTLASDYVQYDGSPCGIVEEPNADR